MKAVNTKVTSYDALTSLLRVKKQLQTQYDTLVFDKRYPDLKSYEISVLIDELSKVEERLRWDV